MKTLKRFWNKVMILVPNSSVPNTLQSQNFKYQSLEQRFIDQENANRKDGDFEMLQIHLAHWTELEVFKHPMGNGSRSKCPWFTVPWWDLRMQSWRCHGMIICIRGWSHSFLQTFSVQHCLGIIFSLPFSTRKTRHYVKLFPKIVEWQVMGYWVKNMSQIYWVLWLGS